MNAVKDTAFGPWREPPRNGVVNDRFQWDFGLSAARPWRGRSCGTCQCCCERPLTADHGRVAERFKAPVLKTGRGREFPREFESHPFRQSFKSTTFWALRYRILSWLQNEQCNMRNFDEDNSYERDPLGDPEAFDLILQGLVALSSVATLASAWLNLRSVIDRRRTSQNQEMVRQAVRQLERALEDLFDGVETALKIMGPAFARSNGGASLIEQPNRFGTRVDLDQDELTQLNRVWLRISNGFQSVRTESMGAQLLLLSTPFPGEDRITENLEDLNQLLNEILFNSRTLEDALEGLRRARRRAEEFLSQVRRLEN